jgi:hypothetical protein
MTRWFCSPRGRILRCEVIAPSTHIGFVQVRFREGISLMAVSRALLFETMEEAAAYRDAAAKRVK